MSAEQRTSKHHLQVVPGPAPKRGRFSFNLETGTLGMALFLASLAVLFVSGLIAYIVVRVQHQGAWTPETAPDLLPGLGLATAMLAGLSAALVLATRSVAQGNEQRFRRALVAAGALALAFLAVQLGNWLQLSAAELGPRARSLYAFTFYMLTGLHALHVIGGLVPLGIVLSRAYAGRYGPQNHAGVRYTAMYWHFLSGVWVILLVAILLVS